MTRCDHPLAPGCSWKSPWAPGALFQLRSALPVSTVVHLVVFHTHTCSYVLLAVLRQFFASLTRRCWSLIRNLSCHSFSSTTQHSNLPHAASIAVSHHTGDRLHPHRQYLEDFCLHFTLHGQPFDGCTFFELILQSDHSSRCGQYPLLAFNSARSLSCSVGCSVIHCTFWGFPEVRSGFIRLKHSFCFLSQSSHSRSSRRSFPYAYAVHRYQQTMSGTACHWQYAVSVPQGKPPDAPTSYIPTDSQSSHFSLCHTWPTRSQAPHRHFNETLRCKHHTEDYNDALRWISLATFCQLETALTQT